MTSLINHLSKAHVYLMLNNLVYKESITFYIHSKAERQMVQDAVDDLRDYRDLIIIQDMDVDDPKHFTVEAGRYY